MAEICSRLDGLPLAIELAAARIRMLSPRAILERLERRLPLLTGGARDVPDRQRTLRGAIDWSHGMLDGSEGRLFARLAVFAGGWTMEAAEEICNPAGELGVDTLDGLTSLADKSLVRPIDDEAARTRFGMLQVIREYAAEQLAAAADADEVHARHARHMLALAEEAEPLLVLTEVRQWQRRLRREEDNLRAALRWALERDEAEMGLRTAGAIWRFWLYWARLREGVGWLESLLKLPGASEPTIGRARALSGLAGMLYWQGESERVAVLYDEALAIYRQVGGDRLIGEALFNSAWGALARGEVPLALERAAEARERYRAAGDMAAATTLKAWLTVLPFFMGAGGSLEDALAAAGEAIEVNRRAGRIHEATDWSGAIAQAYFVAGDPARAVDAGRDALRGFHAMGNLGMYAMSLKAIAALELAAKGPPERVVRLASAAERAFEELGGQLQLLARFGDPMEEARPLLSAEDFARAAADGWDMELEQAVAYALGPEEIKADG